MSRSIEESAFAGLLSTVPGSTATVAVLPLSASDGADDFRGFEVGSSGGRIWIAGSTITRKRNNVTIVANTGPCGSDEWSRFGEACESTLDAYLAKRGGSTAFPGLPGAPFSAAILDPDRRRALLVSDRIGQFTLYHCWREGVLLFATRLSTLARILGGATTFSPQSIHDYVYFHCIPSPSTIYADVGKLDRATIAECDENGTRVYKYWMPAFARSDATPDRDSKSRELRAALRSSIAKLSARSAIPGAFLSGGLDSSSVVGVLAETIGGPSTKAVSMGFTADGYDEIRYARIAAERFQATHIVHYVTPDDIIDCVERVAAGFDEPFGNSSALPTYICARVAKENGIQLLLAGDGGDELFGGNERYSKQLLFERFSGMARLIGPAFRKTALRWSPSPIRRLASKADSFLSQAATPLPDRLQAYNFLHQISPSEVFDGEFLESIDIHAPLRSLREAYTEPSDAHPVDRMLYMDWKFTLRDNDLVKVTNACRLAGVDVAYPMLSDEMVEMSCSIPAGWKAQRGDLRGFFKHAMAGFLPDEILSKPKHGFGLPFGVWTREHAELRSLAYDSVLSLRSRAWFSAPFLERVIALHRQGHAAYYGELLWILMTLELWLRRKGAAT